MDYTPIKIEKASPITVSMRQARLALHQLGVLDQVEAALGLDCDELFSLAKGL